MKVRVGRKEYKVKRRVVEPPHLSLLVQDIDYDDVEVFLVDETGGVAELIVVVREADRLMAAPEHISFLIKTIEGLFSAYDESCDAWIDYMDDEHDVLVLNVWTTSTALRLAETSWIGLWKRLAKRIKKK